MSQRLPAISIVMPVLDPRPDHFRQALQSVLQQTCQDWELVIVEDPSAREVGPIVAEMGDARVRHCLNPQRTSLVDQLNQGLAQSRADLVARFDADDLCETNRLATQRDYLLTHPNVDVVGSQLSIIDEGGRVRGWRSYPTDDAGIKQALPRFNPLAHPSVMYRKRVVLEAGGYCYKRYPACEDYELWSRLARAGRCFANHPAALLRYRIHPGAMKTIHLRGILRGVREVKQMHWADRMDWRGRLRQCGELALLYLPTSIALRLFIWSQYCRRRPST